MRLMFTLGLISVFACRKDNRIKTQKLTSKADTVSQQDGDSAVESQQILFNGNTSDPNDPRAVVRIPAGIFTMGCTKEQGSDCRANEKPAHRAIIKRDFYLMKNEVTQSLYDRVMGFNPSEVKGVNQPVSNVSWYDAVQFCNTLSAIEGLDQCYTIDGQDISWSNKRCNGWRLPTEAEWEYAARGGESFKYAGSDKVDEVAWDASNSDQAQPVGQKKANGYGLYDMSGNVWEWVWDSKGDYHSDETIDPTGLRSIRFRMLRGGSWLDDSDRVRVTYRYLYYIDYEDSMVGFRVARHL